MKGKYINMKDIKIYVATHKIAQFPENKAYIPIQVGAYNKEKFTEVTDFDGDNISIKNPNYCELTAAYWIWKNSKSDITGITHYRRYFFATNTNKLDKVLDNEEIEKMLNDYDIIVPEKTCLFKYKNLKEAYYNIHNGEDWEKCKDIVLKKYPDYKDAFEQMEKQRKFYACNMFITSKEKFDEYYKWLFDILFELEGKIDISNYSNYNKRIYGFLSERLFNVWLNKNKLKVKEMPVYNTDKNIAIEYITNKIKQIVIR